MRNDGRLAFDIETIDAPIPDGVDFDLQNSEHVELFCVCVAYQEARSEPPQHEVILRSGRDADAELDVIEQTVDWLEGWPTETVLTFNGDTFDFPHLIGRANIAAEALGDRFDVVEKTAAFVDRVESDDLRPEGVEAFEDDYLSFERACDHVDVDVTRTSFDEYDIGIDVVAERPTSKGAGPHLMGCDVPIIGERYLNLQAVGATDLPQFKAMQAALEHYATTDVIPLFELADRRPFADATPV